MAVPAPKADVEERVGEHEEGGGGHAPTTRAAAEGARPAPAHGRPPSPVPDRGAAAMAAR